MRSLTGPLVKPPHIVCVLWEPKTCLRRSAVLQSQALGQMRYLLSLGARITLLFSDDPDKKDNDSFRIELNREGFQTIPVSSKGYANTGSIFAFRRHIQRLQAREPVSFVYIRNFWNSFAVPSGKFKVVFDLRGANREETEFRSSLLNGVKAKIYSFFERKAVQRADYLQCVSEPLRRYISERFQRGDAAVVNSCIEKERFEECRRDRMNMRSCFGMHPNDIVFLYSGGLDAYQELGAMFRLWFEIHNVMDNAHFLLLTSGQPSRSDEIYLNRIPKDRLTLQNVAPEQVPRYMSMADFGFLLRKNILLNNVASPTKFPEYLAAGLGIIASPGIGDLSRLVEDQEIGCVVDEADMESSTKAILNLVERYSRDKEGFSSRMRDIAYRRFSWDTYKEYFLNRYFNGERAVVNNPHD